MNSFSQILELTNKRGGSSCYIGDPFSQCQRLLYKWLVESNSYILNILKIFPFIYGHVTCHVIKNFNEGNFRIYFVWLKVLVFLLAYFGEFCYMNSSYSRKYITSMFHALWHAKLSIKCLCSFPATMLVLMRIRAPTWRFHPNLYW